MTGKILYLGPQGSYTHIAALKAIQCKMLSGYELEKGFSISKIVKKVDETPNTLAVLPVENLIEGVVRETVDNIIRTNDNDIVIFKEIIIPVSHCLISKAKNLTDIKHVISHPQALAQCSKYINKNLNEEVHIIPASSTSEAVKSLQEKDSSYAAIGNAKASEIYKIPILKEQINDEINNRTRFLAIGRIKTKPTQNDKTSIAFSTPNEAGALAKVINILDTYGLNMSYIDSRPSKKHLGIYNFYIDFEGHIEDKNVIEAMSKIKPLTTFYRFIGSYPKY